MFLVYIKDMPEGIYNYMSLTADDLKLTGRVKNEEDCEELGRELDTV